ncbi:MAG: holo-ACP synthase [Bacillota bacterium]
MIKGMGIDIVCINRIKAVMDRWGDRFLDRVFCDLEQVYCNSQTHPARGFAARFCAKEAVFKLLTTGVDFREVEVVRQVSGNPRIRLTGRARQLAADRGIDRIHLSLSHERKYAIAQVIGEGE